MKRKLIIVCSLMIASASFSAEPVTLIKGIDVNNDGRMSHVEQAAGISKWFMHADDNNDGYLVESECSKEIMNHADRNRDGKLSLIEHLMAQTHAHEENSTSEMLASFFK